MLIRKLYKFEGSHVVRNCTSRRCRENIHGHSYKVEVLLEGDTLDNGGMLLDFGLMKKEIKEFIDAFDHTHVVWMNGHPDEIEFIKKHNERWIISPITPSAEGFSLLFFYVIDIMLNRMVFNNGEKELKLHSIIVHETETGYAQCFMKDMLKNWNWDLYDLQLSDEIKKDFSNPRLLENLADGGFIINPETL